jgi:hypothetical protein
VSVLVDLISAHQSENSETKNNENLVGGEWRWAWNEAISLLTSK